MPNTTSRLSIVTPLGTEAPNTDAAYKAIADQVDANAAMYGQGTFAALPTSSPGSPGKAGRIYVVTSGAEIGRVYYDHGTGWFFVNPDQTPAADSITAAMLQTDSVGSAEIQTDAVGSAEIAAGAVGASEVANALKPSAGAGAGTEALRAIGTAAGTAAAGTHGSQHALAGSDPLPTDSVDAAQIKADAVGASELANNAVDTAAIVALAVTDAKIAPQTIIIQSGNLTLTTAHRYNLIRMDAVATLTVPTNASQPFSVGDSVDVIQWGTGQVTIAGAGGVTVVGNPGLKIIGQYAMATLIKIATDTWVAVGALTP